ncbi:14693_t:CDS:2 [Racocetra persica]|uniref:14693_t:CDS:1 n=1 Tax=Racocetra persica TaxID=160502 RepID=A0ACA9SF35_9GLOM|nr:14693_t:CDS:2 [Racocetra persica]
MDVMVLVKHEQKVDELVYVECSRIVCTNTKRDDDVVKLWRKALDGISYVGTSYRLASNQFGIVGIQVAGRLSDELCLCMDLEYPNPLEQADTNPPRNDRLSLAV